MAQAESEFETLVKAVKRKRPWACDTREPSRSKQSAREALWTFPTMPAFESFCGAETVTLGNPNGNLPGLPLVLQAGRQEQDTPLSARKARVIQALRVGMIVLCKVEKVLTAGLLAKVERVTGGVSEADVRGRVLSGEVWLLLMILSGTLRLG